MPPGPRAVAWEDTELLALPASELRRAERREPELFDAINRLIGTGLRARSVTASNAAGGLTQSAASIISTPLSTCRSDANIRDLLEIMLRDNVGSLVVVDPVDQIRGMVTFRTLAKRKATRSWLNTISVSTRLPPALWKRTGGHASRCGY